ncbi:nuclear transport factor 2 family protein [Paraburkholderia sp. 22B1P]|nr:nuclear transport factor 2 family protein [Paraburkholderia sp. 22B1P]
MTATREKIYAACMDTLDRFMSALNEHDAQKMDATMHFPHLRLADGKFKLYEAPGHNPMDLFVRLKAEDDWKYSLWDRRDLIQFNDRKAHFSLSYIRFRSDGSIIGTYESLYVLTLQDGKWGIQARSSFGP